MPPIKPKARLRCPPQLFGIYEDAAKAGASTFCLENLPHAIMASFSVRNHAQEIDFEFDSGQEMFDYLLSQPGVRKSRRGHGMVQYGEQSIPCLIEAEEICRGRERIRVSWQLSATPKRV